MQRDTCVRRLLTFTLVLATAWFLHPEMAGSHCDTLEGPVVAEAKEALAKGDVTPVLKWIAEDDEDEIRAAFAKTLKVREMGTDARELADMYFFETLVRIHRASEGEPYMGLKSAESVDPVIEAADKALESGSVDALVEDLLGRIEEGLRERFRSALTAKGRADETVEKGRDFVRTYVSFVHYVERLHTDVGQGPAPPEHEGSDTKALHEH